MKINMNFYSISKPTNAKQKSNRYLNSYLFHEFYLCNALMQPLKTSSSLLSSIQFSHTIMPHSLLLRFIPQPLQLRFPHIKHLNAETVSSFAKPISRPHSPLYWYIRYIESKIKIFNKCFDLLTVCLKNAKKLKV